MYRYTPAPEPVASRLMGSISESDLRRITPGNLDVLAMTVGDFIAKLHAPPGAVWDLSRDEKQRNEIKEMRDLPLLLFPRSPKVMDLRFFATNCVKSTFAVCSFC